MITTAIIGTFVLIVLIEVVNIVVGLPKGWPKLPCPYCVFDSRDKKKVYYKKWPRRGKHVVGEHSVLFKKLVNTKKVIPPPLHLKLGSFANFIKSMANGSPPKIYLQKKFSFKTESKINQGSFNGPKIRKLLNDKDFAATMNDLQLEAWKSFVILCNNFFGTKKGRNYKGLVGNMLRAYKKLGVHESTKLHILNCH